MEYRVYRSGRSRFQFVRQKDNRPQRRFTFHSRFALKRFGATIVETAIVLPVLLLILFTAIDLSILILNNNALSEAARKVARYGTVRGERSAPELTPWGPSSFQGNADEQNEIAMVVRSVAATMQPEDLDIRVEWPDAANQVNDRIHVVLSYPHRPIFGLTGSMFTLEATSTMRIRH